jgi:hypothetical protein
VSPNPIAEMARLSRLHGNTAEHPLTICEACARRVVAEAVSQARREALHDAAEAVRERLTTGLLTPASVANACKAIRALAKHYEEQG